MAKSSLFLSIFKQNIFEVWPRMKFYLALLFVAIAFGKDDKNTMKGHLMPIGYQGTSLGDIPEIKFSPSGQHFYKNYIRKRQPVVIRNAAKHWLALKNWKNETYLREMYGNITFTVSMQKVYDNTINIRKDMKLAEFLDIYKTEPVYLDSPFPATNMINEISLPSVLQCSEIIEKISDAVLLMNSGKAESPLHHDGYENILTVISGTKRIILFDTLYSKNVYADQFDVLPGLSPINISSVDLTKFPKFADVSFYETTLHAGDFMYIPEFWWHYVYSTGTPNIATNIWFGMFDFEEDYEKANISEDKDVTKVAQMFDELVQRQPSDIECEVQSPALDQVLKVVESDTSAEHLRIPKTPKRPGDFILASGYTMPALGFGTAGLYPQDTLPAILSALDAGYRLIDAAQIYGTEPAVAQAIKQSNVPRANVTIVTKLNPKNHGYQSTISSVELSLANLQTDYIDVFLIHTQECDGGYFKCPEGKPDGVWQDSWRAMEHLHHQGKIRSLGVSNFDVADLTELLHISTVPVSVVQNWFDPLHQEVSVRHFCAKHGIHFMGYSTLGTQWVTYGGMDKNPVLTSPTFVDIASHHQFIVAQVILRWAIHLNVTVIPRSHDPRHIVLNYKSLDIVLTDHEIKTITEEYLPTSSYEREDETVEKDTEKLATGGDVEDKDEKKDDSIVIESEKKDEL